jgi:hypothetical protein
MTAYVVQSAQGTATTAAGTVTLPSSTRAGNTLIAMASIRNAGTANASLTGVTLGGVADNFAQAYSAGGASAAGALYWWLDPLCAGGQTSVVFTTAGGAGAEALTMNVLEVGGMIPLPAGPGAVDASSAGTASSASWNSGTTPLTGWSTEIWTGQVVAAGTRAITPAAIPWISYPAQPNGTISITQTAFQVTPTAGSAVYNGSFASSLAYIAGAVTFPALTATPLLPDYPAGSSPQQGDMNTLVTAPLSFVQQRTVFRATQLNTQTVIASGSPGTVCVVAFDTILEDPYQGWNTSTSQWTVPFTGWYQVTTTTSVGTCALNTILYKTAFGGAVMPTTGGGILTSMVWEFRVGGAGVIQSGAQVFSTSNVSTSNSPGSTLEIIWLGFSAS